MYDVCFVIPPRPYLVAPDAQIPLGALYLAAICERGGLSVAIADLSGRATKAPGHEGGTKSRSRGIESSCLGGIPRACVYGISGTCMDVDAVNALARTLKRERPTARVIVGGPIALSVGEPFGRLKAPSNVEGLALDSIDTVFHGEAENHITRLVRDSAEGVEFGTPADVGTLPFPARRLWSRDCGTLGGEIFIDREKRFPGGSTTILSSRGCPFECAFCAGPRLRQAKAVRFRDVDDFVSEMEEVVSEFNVRQFRLCDEFFTCRPSRVHEVCQRIRRSRILGFGEGVAWRASVGVNPHDRELFAAMHGSGCVEVSLGVETADPEVLALICGTRRGEAQKSTVDDAYAALASARSAGLKTRALLMMGLPGTTERTLGQDLRFIEKAPYDALALTVFTPLPGSAIHDRPSSFGCIIRRDVHRDSLCLYHPGGRAELEPTIDVEGLSRSDMRDGIQATVTAAEHTGRLGRG